MKDYSFGNYICALRTGLGLSQFQLGTLVGVSDKAVSKWENGDAKPRIGTCRRLADVLGISINELLSCNTNTPARKELDIMKIELWSEAQKRMSIFGNTPPALCWSRFAAEKEALYETDAIHSFAVLARIAEAAKKEQTMALEVGLVTSSFAAWLLGATKVNPLPPHYRCPKCGKTEFVADVKDGFDLPPKLCTCGALLLRDGHNIPYEGYAKSTKRFGADVDIRVSTTFMPIAANVIKAYYKGKADVLPVKLVDEDGLPMTSSEIYVILSQKQETPQLSEDGFWYADGEEYWNRYKNEQRYTLIEDARLNRIQEIQVDFSDPLIYATSKIAEQIYQKHCQNPAHTAASTTDLCQDLHHGFDLLLKLDGFTHGSGVWCDRWTHMGTEMCNLNGEELVNEGRAVLYDIPAFREDVFNDVSLALARSGIRDNGLAIEVMENARMGLFRSRGISSELESMLFELGLPEWYPEYLKNVMYLFPKGHCVALLLLDMILEGYYERS